MIKELPHIGSKELVELPEYGVVDVPAKIDTGADYSAIWASDITELDGVLEFKLFGAGSNLYTGTVIRVSDYGVTEVRNSFGHSEIRYTVKFAMRLGKKRIRVVFRLADRSRNRYPILVGKKTLHNKFLVDVSVNHRLGKRNARVLVLNSVPSEAVERFVDQLEEVNPTLEPSFVTYDELALLLDKDGIKVLNARTKKPLPTYDLIYFRTHQKKMEMASAMAEYATATNTNFIDLEVAEFRSHTKLSQYARLARYNLSIPKTVILHHTQLEHSFDFIVKNIKLPFVFKDVAADRGEANFLIRNEEDYEKAVKIAQESDAYVAAQQFISNEGDYRCLVLDKKLELVIKRQRQDDTTHLNNTSLGGRAELIDPEEIPSVVHRMAIKSAIVMSRQVAGVDLMQSSETGKWYILEVNNSPQIVGGTFTNEKVAVFAKFLREQAEK